MCGLSPWYKMDVVSSSIHTASYKGSIALKDIQQSSCNRRPSTTGPFVFALFGSPYLLNFFPDPPSHARAYKFYPGAKAALARVRFSLKKQARDWAALSSATQQARRSVRHSGVRWPRRSRGRPADDERLVGVVVKGPADSRLRGVTVQ